MLREVPHQSLPLLVIARHGLTELLDNAALVVVLVHPLGNPKLPFSIITTSMAPAPERSAVELAQLAVADSKKHPEFAGNVATTDARPHWRDAAVSPSDFGYHWNHNGESEYLNGKTMGVAMLKLFEP